MVRGKLERLVIRFLDGTLSEAEQVRVNRLLAKSAVLRRVLVRELATRALVDLASDTLPSPPDDPQFN